MSCATQVDSGIRTGVDEPELLDIGVERLILGTVLAKNPDLAAEWIARYGRRFIAGIDARGGEVKTSGWTESGGLDDLTAARKAAEIGACCIVYTNIDRDGTMTGPDVERTLAVARAAGIHVVLSGGVSGENDIDLAARRGEGLIVGAITGKAVYEGKLDLAALVRKYPQDPAVEASW